MPVDARSVDRIVHLGVQIYFGEGVGQVGRVDLQFKNVIKLVLTIGATEDHELFGPGDCVVTAVDVGQRGAGTRRRGVVHF